MTGAPADGNVCGRDMDCTLHTSEPTASSQLVPTVTNVPAISLSTGSSETPEVHARKAPGDRSPSKSPQLLLSLFDGFGAAASLFIVMHDQSEDEYGVSEACTAIFEVREPTPL